MLGDFYPEGATPQLIAKTIFIAGDPQPLAPLRPDYSPKNGSNIKVEIYEFSGATGRRQEHVAPFQDHAW